MSLNKDDISKVDDIETEVVTIPKWGDVKIKQMSCEDQIEYGNIVRSKGSDMQMLLAVLRYCCVNDDGSAMFTKDDEAWLAKKSGPSILALFHACLALNGMGEKALEQKAKNS